MEEPTKEEIEKYMQEKYDSDYWYEHLVVEKELFDKPKEVRYG